MLQSRSKTNLPRKTLGVHTRCQLWRQNLDDHLPTERGIGGEEYARHPAAAELAIELVCVSQRGLELLAEGACHGRFNIGRLATVGQPEAT